MQQEDEPESQGGISRRAALAVGAAVAAARFSHLSPQSPQPLLHKRKEQIT
jgi:hypothetical protein